MLHELLFGMLGKTGSIIKRSTQGLEVDPSTSLLNASERAVVNELVETGYYYLKLTEFIDLELAETDRDCPDQEDSRLPQVDSYKGQGDIRLAQGDDKQGDYRQIPSVYRKAMAHGLRTALKTYE